MKSKKLMIVVIGLCFLVGCASLPPQFISPDFNSNSISTIGVLKLSKDSKLLQNDTITIADLSRIEEIVIEGIESRDYDVVGPINPTSYKVENPTNIQKNEIEEICEAEKVDAIMLLNLSDYCDEYLGDHKLNLDLILYSAKGDRLWADKALVSQNGLLRFLGSTAGVTVVTMTSNYDVGSSTKFSVGLICGALAGLITEGVTDYAGDAINNRLETIPSK